MLSIHKTTSRDSIKVMITLILYILFQNAIKLIFFSRIPSGSSRCFIVRSSMRQPPRRLKVIELSIATIQQETLLIRAESSMDGKYGRTLGNRALQCCGIVPILFQQCCSKIVVAIRSTF